MMPKLILFYFVTFVFCNIEQGSIENEEKTVIINITEDQIKQITDERVLNSTERGSIGVHLDTQHFPLEESEAQHDEFSEVLSNILEESNLTSTKVTKQNFTTIINNLISREVPTNDTEFQNLILDNIVSNFPEEVDREKLNKYINLEIFISAINLANSKTPENQDDVQNLFNHQNAIIKEDL